MDLMPSIALTNLGLAIAVCLAISALGFRRIDYFVSLGYAFSIVAQAVVFSLVYGPPADGWTVAQAALMLAYGLRLGGFLLVRENQPSFERELAASKQRGAHVRGGYKLLIWVAVALLYVAMFAPTHILLAHGQGPYWSTAPGVVVMLVGLVLEAVADLQKSALKAKAPQAFVHDGLYSIVRYPNYLGEMVFWLGAFFAGVAAFRTTGDWLLAGAGLIAIQLVMLGSARRLEAKQWERYGEDSAFRAYVGAVPVLFPLLPIYSLRRLRVYLG